MREEGRPPLTVFVFARKLLRMDTLQGCSRQLARALDRATDTSPSSEARSTAATRRLAVLLWRAVHLVGPLVALAAAAARPQRCESQPSDGEQSCQAHGEAPSNAAEAETEGRLQQGGISCSGDTGAGGCTSRNGIVADPIAPEVASCADAFVRELAHSLCDSALLEHASRAVLALADAPPLAPTAARSPQLDTHSVSVGSGGAVGATAASADGDRTADASGSRSAGDGDDGDSAALEARCEVDEKLRDSFNYLIGSLCSLRELQDGWEADAVAAAGTTALWSEGGCARDSDAAEPTTAGAAAASSTAAAMDAALRGLRAALSGPCVRHLVLAAAVRALCAADGGSGHGLPPALMARLPVAVVGDGTAQGNGGAAGDGGNGGDSAAAVGSSGGDGAASDGGDSAAAGGGDCAADDGGDKAAASGGYGAATCGNSDLDSAAGIGGSGASGAGGCGASGAGGCGADSAATSGGNVGGSAAAAGCRGGSGGTAGTSAEPTLEGRLFRLLLGVVNAPPFSPATEVEPPRSAGQLREEEVWPQAHEQVHEQAQVSSQQQLMSRRSPAPEPPRPLPARLLLRVARLALVSVAQGHTASRAAAAGQAEAVRGRLSEGLRLLLPAGGADALAVASILSAREFVRRWSHGTLARASAAAAESWRLAFALSDLVIEGAHAAAQTQAAAVVDRETAAMLDRVAATLRLDAELEQLSAGGQQGGDGVLPATPPVGVAAALAGGLLPFLERLLRRAAEQPYGPEAHLVLRLLRPPGGAAAGGGVGGGCGPYLGCLLAYGDPAQAAALVTTMAKVLRRLELDLLAEVAESARAAEAAAAAEQGADGSPGAADGCSDSQSSGGVDGCGAASSPSSTSAPAAAGGPRDGPGTQPLAPTATEAAASLALAVVDAMFGVFSVCAGNWLLAGAAVAREDEDGNDEGGAGPSAGGGGGGGQSPAAPALPERRLALLVSYAAREWLPQLSLLTRLLTPELLTLRDLTLTALPRRALPSHPSSSSAAAPQPLALAITQLVLPLLSWLPMLAYLAASDGGAAAAAAPAAEDWRRLLDEVCAVPLLGCVLQLAPALAAEWGGGASVWGGLPLWSLVESCFWVAAARPAEVDAGGSAWRPEPLRRILPYLQARYWTETAECAEALAARMEAAAASGAAAAAAAAAAVAERDVSSLRATARMLVSPGEVAARLPPTCAYPGCDNLGGDSEAELALTACGGCGAAWYCCVGCRVAHLRAGHGHACAALRRRG